MKKLFWVLIFLGVVFGGCDKKVVYPQNVSLNSSGNSTQPTNQTYPPSSFGTVNGVDTTFYYTGIKLYVNNIFTLGGATSLSVRDWTNIQLGIYAKSPGNYLLSDNNYGSFGFTFINGVGYTINSQFSTDNLHTGMVALTLFDTINHVASGTFHFVANMTSPTPNLATDTVKNGYFSYIRW